MLRMFLAISRFACADSRHAGLHVPTIPDWVGVFNLTLAADRALALARIPINYRLFNFCVQT
jgi:hypothetical protein